MSVAFCMTYCETHKTVNTRNINFTEYYCVAKKKPMRREKTKLQTARVIINFSLWFCGLLSRPELYCDWSLHNNIPESFQAFMVIWVWQSFPFYYFVSWEVKIMTVSNFYLFVYLKTTGDYWPAVREKVE